MKIAFSVLSAFLTGSTATLNYLYESTWHHFVFAPGTR